MNCLGRLSRDSGHMRVPDPPHMITGVILATHFPRVDPRRSQSPAAGRSSAIGASSAITAAPSQYPDHRAAHALRGARHARLKEATTAAPAAVVASAIAKAANAAGSDNDCAIAPVASGAGRRLSALNSEAEASPTAGPAADWRAASAKPHGTIGPVPTPIKAKPRTLAAKPACRLTRAKPAAAIANER